MKLMAILNVTPDSYYEHFNKNEAIDRGFKMIEEGADIIDIGGESTRPGSQPVALNEELNRVIPVIEALRGKVPISIDTMKPEVAEAAVSAGADLINDVSGFRDPEMIEVAKKTGAKVCAMHMQGTPQTMQTKPSYPNGVIEDILNWCSKITHSLVEGGIRQEDIILDPGIGFGKSVENNYEILQNLHKFRALGYPILVGLSRKSFIQKTLGKGPNDLLAATLAMNTYSLLNGADYIRVHDVKEHRDVIDVLRFT